MDKRGHLAAGEDSLGHDLLSESVAHYVIGLGHERKLFRPHVVP